MDTCIIWAGEDPEHFTTEEIGGKAKNLLWLYQQQDNRFIVPEFAIIPTTYYTAWTQENGIYQELEAVTKLELDQRSNDIGNYEAWWAQREFTEKFDGFLKRFPEIEAARARLSKTETYARAWNTLEKHHPTWFEDRKNLTSTEQFEDLLENYKNTQPGFNVRFERAINTRSDLRDTILRSSSPLEDNANGYEGVFTSSSNIAAMDPLESALKLVLTSQFRSYPRYWMERNNEHNSEMAVIIQEYIHSKHTGFLVLGEHRTLHTGRTSIHIDEPNTYPQNFPHNTFKELLHGADKLRKNFTSPNINLEYILTDEHAYVVQIRKNHAEPEPAPIPENAELLYAQLGGSQVGSWTGTTVNLLDKKITPENLDEIDRTHPNAIYLLTVDDFTNYGGSIYGERLFTERTPNKQGVILCGQEWHWNHLDQLYSRNMKLLSSTEHGDDTEITSLETGTKLFVTREHPHNYGTVYKLLD